MYQRSVKRVCRPTCSWPMKRPKGSRMMMMLALTAGNTKRVKINVA